MGVCSAPNCNSNCRNGVRLFSFPADRDRRRRWVINCRRDKWTPTASSRLCERHFEESQFEANRKDGWRKLRPDAVPTIFNVPNPPQLFLSSCCPLKRRALVDEELPKKVFLHDHCYAARTISRRNSDELSSGAEQSSTLRDISPQSRTEIDVTMPVSRIDSHPVCHVEDLKYNCLEYEVKTSHPSPRMHVALRNEVKILRTREQKYIADIRRMKRQLKNTQKMLTNATNNMKKFLTSDQIHQLMSGSSRGRKWSSATVQRSLQVFFACGISGYNFLRSNGQPLPAPRTLRHKIEGIKFENGILMEVFSMMALKVKTMQEKEKDCSLTIDEMSISSSTEYDIRTGRIMGEVTLPGHSGKATHAMVFMLAGITTRWKQTVAYYFSGNSVFGTVLKPIVCNIIQKASEIGLNVLNITTDMGACNQAMWRSFGISCGRMQKTENRIVHPADSSKYLYFLADAPHVIKNLKASLINGQNILLPDWIVAENNLTTNVVSCEPLRILLSFQENMQLKISPGLSEKILKPSHFDKMKVSSALSFFSNSNSAALEYLVRCQNYSSDFLTTAWFLKTLNKWFDLISSRRRVTALSLRNTICYQQSVEFLQSIIHLFEEIKIGNKGCWKPIQTGIILTTKSILDISGQLLSSGYKFVLTSRFTSDCIENLFSCIRTNNPVPTPLEFKNKLRLLTISQFLKLKTSRSYQNDERSLLVDFSSIKASEALTLNDADEDIQDITFENASDLTSAELSSLFYLAGYLVSRILISNSTCSSCIPSLHESNSKFATEHRILLQLKSYKDGCLISPSETVFSMIKRAEQIFRTTALSLIHHRKNVHKVMLSVIQAACHDFKLPFCHDVKKILLSRFITFRLRIWAKDQRLLARNNVGKSGELGSKSMAMHVAVKKYK